MVWLAVARESLDTSGMSTPKDSSGPTTPEPLFLRGEPSQPAVRTPVRGACALFGIAVSQSDRWLAAAQDNGLVTIYQPEIAAMGELEGPLLVGAGHEGRVCCVAFVPNDLTNSAGEAYQCAVSGGVDGAIRTWHLGEESLNDEIRHHDSSVMCVAFTPSAELLISGSEDGTVAIYDWSAREVVRRIITPSRTVLGIDVSPDGRLIAFTGLDRAAHVWTVAGVRVGSFSKDNFDATWGVRFLDDERLVLSSGDGGVSVWTPARSTSELIYRAEDPRYTIHGLAVRSDRRQIAFGYRNDVILVALGDRTADVRRMHTGEVNGVAYLADGRVASVADDGGLFVWSSHTPGAAPELMLHAGALPR